MIDDTGIAWAAGFFDGEGTTSCWGQANGHIRIGLRVPQKTPELLEQFQTIVGGFGQISQGHTREMYTYGLNGLANVQHVLGLLWPYLGEEKRKQAVSAVEKWIELKGSQRYCVSKLSEVDHR